MSDTTQIRFAIPMQSPPEFPSPNAVEHKTNRCLYCIDSAVKSPSSFLDIDLEANNDFIEQIEAMPRTARLVMAMTLLAEILLLLEQS